MKSVLAVAGLRVERGETVIIQNIQWKVEPGQHWAILGANGSGKTSLLNCLAGYLTPTDGSIAIGSDSFGTSDWRHIRQKIGLVSSSLQQRIEGGETALETVITGKYAMINFWGKSTPRDRAQARNILRQVELEYVADRAWLYLSQGERQRVLIGRALMSGLKILILDEPCAGLDPVARENFLQFLQRLSRKPQGPTLILVTHHVEEIMPAFTHVLLLKKGKVLAQGEKEKYLTSALLSKLFSSQLKLRQQKNRYALTVLSHKRVAA